MLRNYRKKHYSIILIMTTVVILTLVPENWPDWVSNLIILGNVFGFGALGAGEKTEKADEMTNFNLSKANKAALCLSLISLFVFGLLGDENEIVKLPANVFMLTMSAMIILRSVLFIVFDKKGNSYAEE